MKKILLANPRVETRATPPLGLCYIAAILEKDGHNVKIYDPIPTRKGLSKSFEYFLKQFNPDIVAEDIEEALRDERDERIGQETFSVQSFSQLLETFTDIFAVVQAVLIGIAAISLIVGGIGIMNTMYTSVLERTKEIGIMKAVGARNRDIFLIFLIESGLLGLVGGIIGILLGIGIGKGVEYLAASQLGTPFLQAIFGFPLILSALAFSFIIGAASGVLPAMQAARLKPADALRYE